MVTLTKEQLSELKRPELQKICKEKGIKGGNQKKDILVDLILNHDNTVQQDDDKPDQPIDETDGNLKSGLAKVDGPEDEPEQAPPTLPASRSRSASSRQPASSSARAGTTTSRKAAAPPKASSARSTRKQPAKRVDIVAIDDEEDTEEAAVVQEDEPEAQEAEPQPLHSTDPSPLLPQESQPSPSSQEPAAQPSTSQAQPTASTSTSTMAITSEVARLQSQISSLPTQEQYALLAAQVSSANEAFESMSGLPRRVDALPTRAELETLKRDMLARGWVRREDVEAIVEERMSKVEKRLATLEAGSRPGSAPPSSSASSVQRVASSSSLGKHPRSPTVTFASPQPTQTFGSRLPSGGVGSGTPASSSAYGTLGLGFGQPSAPASRSGDGGPSPKKMRVVSGQSDMDAGLVDAMLDDEPAAEDDDPDRTVDEDQLAFSPPNPSRSRSGTPHQDPLLTPPPRASPGLPDNSYTPKAGPPPSAHRPTPLPMSSHALHTHHHPFDPTAGGSHSHQPSPFAPPPPPQSAQKQKNMPIGALPFPIFATSPRPPVIAPASPTLSVGWGDSPRKTSGGGPSGAAQMSMSSASSTGGLTPGRALFTSATGPGGETPKAYGGRGTPGKRGVSASGAPGLEMFGGVPGSGATLQGLVSGGGPPGSVTRGGPLFHAGDALVGGGSKPNSSSSQPQSIFGAPLPLPPSVTGAGLASSSSTTFPSTTSTPTSRTTRHVSDSLLPPLPLNAPGLSLSPAFHQPQPYPFPLSPAPGAAPMRGEMGMGMGLRGGAMGMGMGGRMPPPPTPPAQRTLFGTEREVDGRFGDDDE